MYVVFGHVPMPFKSMIKRTTKFFIVYMLENRRYEKHTNGLNNS